MGYFGNVKPKAFEFQLRGVRGFPAFLLVVLGGIALLGLLALLLFVGVAVAVGGLVLSAGAALIYTLRRRFAGIVAARPEPPETGKGSTVEVREIEVEVLPGEKR